MNLKEKYGKQEFDIPAALMVSASCNDAERNAHGAVECLEARLGRLEEIVGRLVARLPESELLETCGLQHSYKVVP